jgi:hypothetical protein
VTAFEAAPLIKPPALRGVSDFTPFRIHIGDNFMDQRSGDAFLQANIGVRIIPHRLQVGC